MTTLRMLLINSQMQHNEDDETYLSTTKKQIIPC
jgi:hypothetical protein